eukprot:CAMPEP_0180659442 /NCGR_PEP_ID=MMETSP1037_2-20121125/57586_1 /TAXON_ID=632150 /ORGANISM="Azadinium spinosum, Strain 3D9" /LENGTH=51 /DNA_ID=CAMNT_0022686489 /DNA_START=24 /DNA_END=175 /DNA_ORIENTATION=+
MGELEGRGNRGGEGVGVRLRSPPKSISWDSWAPKETGSTVEDDRVGDGCGG